MGAFYTQCLSSAKPVLPSPTRNEMSSHTLGIHYTRMLKSFDDLLHKVEPYLTRRRYTSSARPSISSAERLLLTLRYLATGDINFFNFRVRRSTVCNIVYETCCVVWKVLHMEYVQFPSIQHKIGISQQFWRKWNFPNCLGAIDGKHILMRERTIGDNGLQKIGKVGSNHYSSTVKSVCECFSDYFSSPEGAFSWQDKHIHRTLYN